MVFEAKRRPPVHRLQVELVKLYQRLVMNDLATCSSFLNADIEHPDGTGCANIASLFIILEDSVIPVCATCHAAIRQEHWDLAHAMRITLHGLRGVQATVDAPLLSSETVN